MLGATSRESFLVVLATSDNDDWAKVISVRELFNGDW